MNWKDGYKKIPYWARTNKYYKAKLQKGTTSFDEEWDDEREECGPQEAVLLSSYSYTTPGGTEMHQVILDLDIEHALVPSTSPGHSHLYINKTLSYDKYLNLLTALADAGIVEQGIVRQAIKYKGTTVRLPHVKKEFENPEAVPVESAEW